MMPLFGEDADGAIWVFGIPSRAWKGIGIWCAMAFFVEAPDALSGLQTAGICLVVLVAFIWVLRVLIWMSTVVFRPRRRD